MSGTMGIDQYGESYHALGKYPRKELLERLYATSAQKMYRDMSSSEPLHVGYIIRGLRIELFTVTSWKDTQCTTIALT